MLKKYVCNSRWWSVDDLLIRGAGASERTVMWGECCCYCCWSFYHATKYCMGIRNSSGDVEVSTELGIGI